MKKLLASILDGIIVFGMAALLVLIGTLILKLIGFVFVAGIAIYAYVIVVAILSILYSPVVESTKLNTTVGKKLLEVK